jgi:hypothetical protein
MFTSTIHRTFKIYFNSHLLYRKKIGLIPVSEQKIRQWFNTKRTFFIVSTGRTGTKWLVELLNLCTNALVEHEPVPMETIAHKAAMGSMTVADKYIKQFRLKEIYLRVAKKHPDLKIYGEGKDVVRSIMSRGTYSGKHPVYHDFRPPIVDRFSERWEGLSEFEKTCWIWQWENRFMRQHIDLRARIEDITSSYALFKKQILEPLDLHLEVTAWKAQAQRPKNVSPKYTLGNYDHWTLEQKDQFVHICGKEMQHYGY